MVGKSSRSSFYYRIAAIIGAIAFVTGSFLSPIVSDYFRPLVEPIVIPLMDRVLRWFRSDVLLSGVFISLLPILLAIIELYRYTRHANQSLRRDIERLSAEKANQEVMHKSEIERLEFHHEQVLRRDPMTQIPNHFALEQYLNRELQDAWLNHQIITAIFLDVHHLHELNKRFGYSAGSSFLRLFARTVYFELYRKEMIFRVQDRKRAPESEKATLFRLHTGGDEFLIFLKGYEIDAYFLLRRILLSLEQKRREFGSILANKEGFQPLFTGAIYQTVYEDIRVNDLITLHRDDRVSVMDVLELLMQNAEGADVPIGLGTEMSPEYGGYALRLMVEDRMRSKGEAEQEASQNLRRAYDELSAYLHGFYERSRCNNSKIVAGRS